MLLFAGIALAATVPFIHKAFHIDDVLYLNVAHRILEDPLRPYGDRTRSVVLWDAEDGRPDSLFDTDFNPPLWKYILAAAIHLVGDEEWKLHLVTGIFLLMGTTAWGWVAMRWTTRPVWLSAMLVWSPFFLPGQNIMLEVPVFCFAGWGIFFLSRAWESGSILSSLVAGLFIGLAVLTKYSAGVLLPVLVVGALVSGKYRTLVGLIPPVVLIGLWCLHNAVIYGDVHLISHGNLFKPHEWGQRTLIVLRTIGGVSFLWPLFWASQPRTIAGRLAVVGSIIGAVVLSLADLAMIRRLFEKDGLVPLPIQEAHFLIMTFLGALTILLPTVRSIQQAITHFVDWQSRRVDRTLEVWILGMLIFNVACTPFNAVRHLLLALIPMTFLACRTVEGTKTRLPAICLAISACLGFALAAADYEMADTYRHLAQTRLRQDITRGDTVWFTGAWGFAYYAEKEGAKPLFDGTEEYGLGKPAVGDRIYNPVIITWRLLEPAGLQWVEHLQPEGLVPLRTIAAGAHYYGINGNGLPWEFLLLPPRPAEGREGYQFPPLDHLRIWLVRQTRPGLSPWQPRRSDSSDE
jgi:hypothetical protein